MGLAAIEITGGEKQGLGYVLIVNGKIWPAKINDPGTITFTRNRLDTTHSLTEDFKQSKPEELAEALEQAMNTFFDPTLAEQFDIMGSAGATEEREIYMMFPRLPLKTGQVKRENAFIYAPQGYIAADSIAMPLDNYMEQSVNINGGTANTTVKPEAIASVLLPATAVTMTPVELSAANLVAGSIVGEFSTNIAKIDDVSLFILLAGTDAAEFYLDGHYLKSVGTPTAALKSIDVTTSNFVGFDTDDASLKYVESGIAFTITA